MSDEIDVCPYCDSVWIRSRSQSDFNWRCRACKSRFDESDKRPPKFAGDQTDPNHGLAGRLAGMDADEVTADE